MKIDALAKRAGEWFCGAGPETDVVITSRIRLARNLSRFPFLSKATDEQRGALCTMIRGQLASAPTAGPWTYLDLDQLDDLDQQILVERHLISRQHAGAKGQRGVAVSEGEEASIMVNEEDHLRLQARCSGLQLDAAWEKVSLIDDMIEEKSDFAFHPRYGYLTACPTNVGTGIRVSVMLHMPALKLTGEIERVFRAAKDMRLAIRGFLGEGTDATGDLFQVSNQVTLGRTEEDIINEFKQAILPRMIDYERKARQALVDSRPLALDDRIWRSYGTLQHARTISSEETMLHLSHLRMGVHLGRIKQIDLATINELFLLTQPAHLQKIHGSRLGGDQRGFIRAEYIRRRLEAR